MKNVLIISLVLLMAGCSSRQKEVQRSSSKLDFKTSIDTTAQLSKQSDFKSNSLQTTHKMFLNTDIEYIGAAGDSLSIEKYGPDGQLESKTVIKGKGKLKSRQSTRTEQTASETSKAQKSDENLSASGKHEINKSAEEVQSEKNIKTLGFIFFTWFGLAILILLVLIVRYFWKRYQKIKELKNHITDDFI